MPRFSILIKSTDVRTKQKGSLIASRILSGKSEEENKEMKGISGTNTLLLQSSILCLINNTWIISLPTDFLRLMRAGGEKWQYMYVSNWFL